MSKRLSTDATHNFFERRDEQNKVKTEIVVDFFKGYVPIVLRGGASEVRYVDLYAGRGYYDACKVTGQIGPVDATPLAILRAIIADEQFARNVSTWFNEGEAAYLRDLRAAARALNGFDTMTHPPTFTDFDVAQDDLALHFGQGEGVPTFAFLDPYGYKGLTRELVAALLKDWGCDVAFFFNYARINRGLGHQLFDEHFEKIFGERRLEELRISLAGVESERREAIVIHQLRAALREIGANHVLTFRFRVADGRTSHHLVFASKHSRGYKTMREKMAKHSTKDADDIPYFEFIAGDEERPTLFDPATVRPPRQWPHSVRFLADTLHDEYRGNWVTFATLRDAWLLREELPYSEKHYRQALWRMQDDGRVELRRSTTQKAPRRGDVPPDTVITFRP